MSKKEWDSDYASIIKPRIEKRSRYGSGPASGKGILSKYHDYYDIANRGIKEPKVLFLGATPELRDCALSKGARVFAIDINKNSLEAMADLMTNRGSKKETTIVGNWLEMQFEDNYFDFVWGDGVTNNVLFAEYEKLFSEISRVLKPSGHLLLRDVLLDPKEATMSVKDAIVWVHKNKMHHFDLFFKLYFYSTDTTHIDKEKYLVDMAKITDYMEKNIYGRSILTKKEEEYLKDFMTGTVKSTFVPYYMWLAKFKKYFDLIEIGKVDDFHFCKYFNFFFAKVKK